MLSMTERIHLYRYYALVRWLFLFPVLMPIVLLGRMRRPKPEPEPLALPAPKEEPQMPAFIKEAPPLWMSEEIIDLEDKRLWNIVQALDCGEWASGRKASCEPVMYAAIMAEYDTRKQLGHYSRKKVKKIRKANTDYVKRFQT